MPTFAPLSFLPPSYHAFSFDPFIDLSLLSGASYALIGQERFNGWAADKNAHFKYNLLLMQILKAGFSGNPNVKITMIPAGEFSGRLSKVKGWLKSTSEYLHFFGSSTGQTIWISPVNAGTFQFNSIEIDPDAFEVSGSWLVVQFPKFEVEAPFLSRGYVGLEDSFGRTDEQQKDFFASQNRVIAQAKEKNVKVVLTLSEDGYLILSLPAAK